MVKFGVVSALAWAAGLVVAAPSPAPLVGVRTRNIPGRSDEYTLHHIWRRIVEAAQGQQKPVFSNSTTLDKSWNGATLFSYTYEADTSGTKLENLTASVSIDVTCVTCYFKAGATAQLTVDGDFDLGGAFLNVTGQIVNQVGELARSTVESLDEMVNLDELKKLIGPGDFELDELVNFDVFDIDTDFDIELPDLPQVQLLFQIDSMDLYMEFDTTIAAGATLTIPLVPSPFAQGSTYSSKTPVAEFLTNITGGANQVAEDGCALKIVQEYTLAVGAAAGATLAVGSHTWGPNPSTSIPLFYTTLANVCAVTANATPTPTTTAALAARQADDPNLDTQTITTKVLYTGISCISPGLTACPQSLQTTGVLTSTKTTVTAVPSGQTATFPPSTALTVARTIPFGDGAQKLAATSGVPVSYVPPPPPPPETSTTKGGDNNGDGNSDIGDVIDDIGEVFHGETGGVSNKLIIGLSVGLGVPFVALLIFGLVRCLRKRRYAPVPKSDTAVEYTGGAYESPMDAERKALASERMAMAAERSALAADRGALAAEREAMVKKTPDVEVGEVRT
ncbi:hypothetical protein C8A01DRAFT_48438 [Parachaetomium inaequale]|uniref:Mid2 domain-containing protein n=1 Tax=Parachaetomium inaequale TaxID=2588326 RepID=A0AAN6PG26_9PEZI|nr:hypothetical protein C8A01DRAFT_48438 [Parachaetomium inaequale]